MKYAKQFVVNKCLEDELLWEAERAVYRLQLSKEAGLPQEVLSECRYDVTCRLHAARTLLGLERVDKALKGLDVRDLAW
jgi:hypothetical protein